CWGRRQRAAADRLAQRLSPAAGDLARLESLLGSNAERASHHEAVAALASYQDFVERERALVGKRQVARATEISEGPAREAIDKFDQAMGKLAGLTSAEVAHQQPAVREP